MNRIAEVRSLLNMTEKDVIKRAGDRLRVCENLDELHETFAKDVADEIVMNNKNDMPTKIILPVGPTGQYPFLIQIIEKEKISLKNCWFFFMDEYCDSEGNAVDVNHPLSFKKIAFEKFLAPLQKFHDIRMEQVFFPNQDNLKFLEEQIASLGGLDTCYGGIGIHGHVAFNEPESDVSEKSYRKVNLNDFTVTINAVRAFVGGNLECFPRQAYTIGMKQILSTKRIRLYCRNGTDFDWANTILRIALFGAPGDDYPVTHIRDKDYLITTDLDTLKSPKKMI